MASNTLSRRVRERAIDAVGLMTTPLLPSDYLDLLDPLRSGTELRGRVLEVRPETPDAATLVIRPGRGWRGHRAGQYVRLGVDVDGVRCWRAYSLTSPPERSDGCLTVTVKAMPDGRVSTHLVRRSGPGMIVQLDQACGDFTLPHPAPPRALFLTAGSGITPVMGMLRSALSQLDDVVLVHSAPKPADVIFAGELRALSAAGRIRLIERHTDTEGQLDPRSLPDLVPDLDERVTWACGPAGMLATVEALWHERGIDERLHTERFRANVLVAGEGGTVSFGRSSVEVDSDGATSILDAGEAAGVLMPSGCRMGICYGCVAPLLEGAVRDLRTGDLTVAAPGDGVIVQTCVSAAAGPCTINL